MDKQDPASKPTATEHIENARAMADNLIQCPPNEQNIGETLGITAQAIRNLCDVVEILNARMAGIEVDPPCDEYDPAGSGAGAEEDGHPQCAMCGHPKSLHKNDPAVGAAEQIDRLASYIQSLDCGEPSQPDEGAGDCAIRMIETLRTQIAEAGRETTDRFSQSDEKTEARVDRCIKEIIDWCKRVMPHFQRGPEFEVAKKFDDELHEICRRHIIRPRDERPAPPWLAGEIVDYLNALVEIDRDAVRALVYSRVPCNQEFADHPTVQVRAYGLEDKPHDFEVGILGLLNGFVGIDADGCGLIQMVIDDEDEEHIEFRLAVE